MKRGKLDTINLTNDVVLKEIIRALWREYPGLYNEKYKAFIYDEDGNIVDTWLRNTIADAVNYGQALGQGNVIEGNKSAAFGFGNNTKSFLEIILGAYAKIPENQNPTDWIPTDMLLTLGNGPDKDHRSNVFEILKNGLIRWFFGMVIGKWPDGQDGEDGGFQFIDNFFKIFYGGSWHTLVDGDSIVNTLINIFNNPTTNLYYAIQNIANGSSGGTHESYLLEDTVNALETQVSTWSVVPLAQQIGEFKATVLIRNKSTDTIITVSSLLSFDWTAPDQITLQNNMLTDGSISLVVGINGSNMLYATVSGMPTDAKRIHWCFERCILKTRILESNATGEIPVGASMEADANPIVPLGEAAVEVGVGMEALAGRIVPMGDVEMSGGVAMEAVVDSSATIKFLVGTDYDLKQFFSSKNGVNWISQNGLNANNEIYSIHYLNGYWIVGCALSDNDWNYTDGMLVSTDGENWTAMGLNIVMGGCAAYNGSGTYVIVGTFTATSGKCLAYCTSDPSIPGNWTLVSSVIFNSTGSFVGFLNGVFIAGGGYGTTNVNTIAYSYDGITWTGLGKTIFDYKMDDLAFDGIDTYIGVGPGNSVNNMAYCTGDPTNISNWHGLGKTIFSSQGLSVAYGNGIWVAGGQGTNSLAYCTGDPTNIANWTGLGTSVFPGMCMNVKFHNGYFYAVGDKALRPVQKSSDGVNWSNATDVNLPYSLCIGIKP